MSSAAQSRYAASEGDRPRVRALRARLVRADRVSTSVTLPCTTSDIGCPTIDHQGYFQSHRDCLGLFAWGLPLPPRHNLLGDLKLVCLVFISS